MKITIGPYLGTKSKKKERNIKVHIDKYDTWNMDATLAVIIYPMLVQLKATKHGSPSTDDEDVPEELRSFSAPKKENEWDTDENFFKRWDWILDEMLFAFKEISSNEEGEEHFRRGESHILVQAYDADNNPIGEPKELGSRENEEDVKNFKLLFGPNHTMVIDEKGLKAYHERISNGLKLFGKYYRNLWD